MSQISYESPKLVRSQINAWTATVQCAAVVTTLFSGIAVQLLAVIRSDDAVDKKTGKAMMFLVFSSYAAMLFNAISTVASLFLIDLLGDIDLNESRKGRDRDTDGIVGRKESSLQLLRRFGARRNLKYIFMQWMIYLFLATFFVLAQMLAYMWLRDGPVLSAILTGITGVAISGLYFTSYYELEF
ncbi:hypothetical protein B0H11DRAFT_2273184 [Mycena galericulata]|nr:hypothetical protein B0H11DRAFT_2273184 [Mycena galericulata]